MHFQHVAQVGEHLLSILGLILPLTCDVIELFEVLTLQKIKNGVLDQQNMGTDLSESEQHSPDARILALDALTTADSVDSLNESLLHDLVHRPLHSVELQVDNILLWSGEIEKTSAEQQVLVRASNDDLSHEHTKFFGTGRIVNRAEVGLEGTHAARMWMAQKLEIGVHLGDSVHERSARNRPVVLRFECSTCHTAM